MIKEVTKIQNVKLFEKYTITLSLKKQKQYKNNTQVNIDDYGTAGSWFERYIKNMARLKLSLGAQPFQFPSPSIRIVVGQKNVTNWFRWLVIRRLFYN